MSNGPLFQGMLKLNFSCTYSYVEGTAQCTVCITQLFKEFRRISLTSTAFYFKFIKFHRFLGFFLALKLSGHIVKCLVFNMVAGNNYPWPQSKFISRVPPCLSPLRNWDPPLACGKGDGGPQFGRLETKPSTLSTLCPRPRLGKLILKTQLVRTSEPTRLG